MADSYAHLAVRRGLKGGDCSEMRILIAKTALDGHWRGVATVASALRDAGMEVIYAGALTAEEIVLAAIQEGVDIIGLNVGGRIEAVHQVTDLLHLKDVRIPVIAGGTISPEEVTILKQWGVSEVFLPGSFLDSIVKYCKEISRAREA